MTDFSIESSLVCTLTKDRHILNQPRKLPCKRIACLLCIKNQKKNFLCKFCRNEHNNTDFARDLLCEESIESNLDKISSHESQRLKASLLNTNDLFSNSINAIDGLFDFYQYEIELRFESLRSGIDLKAKETLNNIRTKLTKDFDDLEMKFNRINFKANKSLIDLENNFQGASKIDTTINEIKGMIEKTGRSESVCSIDESRIGTLADPCAENSFNFSQFKKLKQININFDAFDICEYNDNKLIITNNIENSLLVLKNESFRLLNTIKVIGTVELIRPSLVSIDILNKFVYLCINKNKILIIDISLDKIIHEIEAQGVVCDMCLKNGSLFFLNKIEVFKVKHENKSKSIIDFTPTLSHQLKSPMHMSIVQDLIAISNARKILIFNLETGEESSEIVVDDGIINSILFVENGNFLVTHLNRNDQDIIVCFKKSDDKWEVNFEFEIDEIMGSWSMKYIKGHLVLVSWGRNIIII